MLFQFKNRNKIRFRFKIKKIIKWKKKTFWMNNRLKNHENYIQIN